MRTVKNICLFVATAWALALQGQPTGGSLTLDLGAGKTMVTDVLEKADGGYLLTVKANNPAGATESWICSVGPTLGLEAVHAMDQMDSLSNIMGEVLLMPNGDMVSVGAAWEEGPTGELRMVIHGVESDGSNSLLQEMLIGGDTLRPFSMSSTVDEEGNILIVGTMHVRFAALPNQFLMMKADPENGEAFRLLLKHGGSLGITRHALPGIDHLIRVSMDGSLKNVVQGIATFHRFNQDLEYQDGFALSSLGGSNSNLLADSIPHEGGYMTALAGDTLLVSGRFGTLSGGMRASLVRVGPNGAYAGMFLPRSTYLHDCTPITQGHDLTVDGKVVFAVTENFDPFPPDPHVGNYPTRSHAFRLDTLLNPECEFILDGFAENACHYLTRVKATSDGGFLLMGSRRDLNTMEEPRAWVMKVDAGQCSPMGISEETRSNTVAVYPNPGSQGFTLRLKRDPQNNARMDLYDALGHPVITRQLVRTMEFIDAAHLPSGMYLYRVTGADGSLLGAGQWIKQ